MKEYLLEIKNKQKADRNILDKNISALSSFVNRYYSKDSPYKERVEYFVKAISMFKLHKRDNNPLYGISTETIMNEMNDVIDNIITEIEHLGLPNKNKDLKIDKSININNNISQTQSQSVDIDILVDLIKNELKGSQIKELKTIAENEPNIVKRKSKILKKINEFGLGILSNIVTNIISNPAIFNML